MKQSLESSKNQLLSFISTLFIFAGVSACTLIPETDPERGATTITQDLFGDNYTTVKYLDQGWDIADSLWFYTTTQGSNLMPYDFLWHWNNRKSPDFFVLMRT